MKSNTFWGTEALKVSAGPNSMLLELKLPQLRLFESPEDLIQRAYDTQSERIAFVRDDEERKLEDAEEGDSWRS